MQLPDQQNQAPRQSFQARMSEERSRHGEARPVLMEEDTPEVFALQPLSRRSVTVRVRRRGPARFHFVDDD